VTAREILQGVRVAPSILSADFGRLREQVSEVLQAGARVIHVDVMDGHFVPQITMGPNVVGALAEAVHEAGAMLDVHLMIERPERSAGEFVRAGADSVTLHAEATPHLAYAVNLIAEAGACVGVAINPGTIPEAGGGRSGDRGRRRHRPADRTALPGGRGRRLRGRLGDLRRRRPGGRLRRAGRRSGRALSATAQAVVGAPST
jgi:hypothetical protein